MRHGDCPDWGTATDYVEVWADVATVHGVPLGAEFEIKSDPRAKEFRFRRMPVDPLLYAIVNVKDSSKQNLPTADTPCPAAPTPADTGQARGRPDSE